MNINKNRVVSNVVKTLQSLYDCSSDFVLNCDELEVYRQIMNFMQHAFDNDSISCLDIDVEEPESDMSSEEEDTDEEQQSNITSVKRAKLDSDLDFDPTEYLPTGSTRLHPHKAKQLIETLKSRPNQSPDAIASRVNVNVRTVYAYKKALKDGGSIRKKLQQLDSLLFDEFCDLREAGLLIRDNDLRQMALDIAAKLEIASDQFRACESWIYRFKKHHRIKIRKITRYMTYRQFVCLDSIAQEGLEYVERVNSLLPQFDSDQVYNFDQSGFQREIHRQVTLAICGTKGIDAVVDNLNAMSHSYTIMPLLVLSGRLGPKLYICLQEVSGHFPKTKVTEINTLVQKLGNVFVTCSTSGKMGTKDLHVYLENCFWPFAGNRSLLNVDSWTPFKKAQNFKPPKGCNKTVVVENIPPKTTYDRQPLDRQFFRTYKSSIKQIYDYSLRDKCFKSKLHHRDTIIKIHSFVYHQYSSPRFSSWLQRAWHVCGFAIDEPSDIFNPHQYLFEFKRFLKCDSNNCNNSFFVRCTWCQRVFCFDHFYNDPNFHFSLCINFVE